jgi:hypothetical protein
MFNKIKEFFTGGKPAVETTTQEVPMTAADVAIKNIKETTASVDAKIEVTSATTPVAEATPAPAVKEQAWTKNPPAAIAKRAPRQQPVKATTAPKKKKPAAK